MCTTLNRGHSTLNIALCVRLRAAALKALLGNVEVPDAERKAFRSRNKTRVSRRTRAAYWDSPVVCPDGERVLKKAEVESINRKFNEEATEIAERARWAAMDESKDEPCADDSCPCTKPSDCSAMCIDYDPAGEREGEEPRRGRKLSSDLWVTRIPKEPKRWMKMITPYSNWAEPHWNPKKCRVLKMPIPDLDTVKLLENGDFIACILNWNWREHGAMLSESESELAENLVCSVKLIAHKQERTSSASFATRLACAVWIPFHLDSIPTPVPGAAGVGRVEIPTRGIHGVGQDDGSESYQARDWGNLHETYKAILLLQGNTAHFSTSETGWKLVSPGHASAEIERCEFEFLSDRPKYVYTVLCIVCIEIACCNQTRTKTFSRTST